MNKFKLMVNAVNLTATITVTMLFVSCTTNGEPVSNESQEIMAEVCTEGTGREAVLFVRNLNKFSWDQVRLEIVRGGQTYILGMHAEHVDQNRWTKLMIEPEITKAAEPFTDPTKFTSRADASRDRDLLRLTSFDQVKSATLVLDRPFASEWTSAISKCE